MNTKRKILKNSCSKLSGSNGIMLAYPKRTVFVTCKIYNYRDTVYGTWGIGILMNLWSDFIETCIQNLNNHYVFKIFWLGAWIIEIYCFLYCFAQSFYFTSCYYFQITNSCLTQLEEISDFPQIKVEGVVAAPFTKCSLPWNLWYSCPEIYVIKKTL